MPQLTLSEDFDCKILSMSTFCVLCKMIDFFALVDRNHGAGAPFATSDSMISTGRADRPAANQQVVGDDYMTPKQQQAANKSRYFGLLLDGITC